MKFFQHRYYKLTKTLMTLIGQWPYQSIRARLVFLAIVIVFNTTQIPPVIAAFVKHRGDQTIILDCFIAIIFIVGCLTKFIFFMCNSQRTLHLVDRIRTDWQVWAWKREVDILHEYTERGQKTIIMYTDLSILRTVMVYSTLFIFMAEPVVPKIIDVLLMNGTEPGRFPFPVEYIYFNEQKYYFYIIIYSSVSSCVMCTVSIASDVMLIVYVQHGCGIFAALGYTNLIEAIYSWTFFIIVALGIILSNVIGLQILMRKNDTKSNIRLIIFALAAMVYFSMISCLSQILMDHSDIRFHIHNSQWYRLSPKAQKHLRFMTMRCNVPCQLTVGHFFIMSMTTFGETLRTNLSYFMAVCSMQQL